MSLERAVRASLQQTDPWHDPALAEALAAEEMSRLQPIHGGGAYTSLSFLPDKLEECCLGILHRQGSTRCIEIRSFEPHLPRRYAELGMQPCRLDPGLIVEQFAKALDLTAVAPAAARSIEALTRVIHPLGLEDPAFDVSYSEPLLPLSIFVGVPAAAAKQATLRIAEGMLHEAMHLQLSLIERHVRLVQPKGTDMLHSPWRGTTRPVGGILHGLYVFRAIRWFMDELASKATLSPDERKFCAQRSASIYAEIASVEDLRDHPALTDDGARLVSSLLFSHRRPQAA